MLAIVIAIAAIAIMDNDIISATAPIMGMAIVAMSVAADAKLTRTVAIASRACSAVFGPAAIDVSMDAGATVSDDAADAVVSFAWPVANFIAVPRTSDEVRRLRADSDVLGVSNLPPSEADVMGL